MQKCADNDDSVHRDAEGESNGAESLVRAIEAALLKSEFPIDGSDSEGIHYDSISNMWRAEGVLPPGNGGDGDGDKSKREDWYEKAARYWEDEDACPATVDGVLGGFADLSPMDLAGSRNFLEGVAKIRPELRFDDKEGAACECGAGIGRVSKGLLLPIGFKRCDLVESSPRLISAAPEYIGDPYASRCRFLCTSLQEFDPAPGRYDLVWIQWCIGYLNDVDCVPFLRRMGRSLRTGGIICIKDNTCTEEAFVVDKDDSSLTRSLPYLLALAELAGLHTVLLRTQDDFPEDIFYVPMIAFEVKFNEDSAKP